MALLVKKTLLPMQETPEMWVQSLSWEDPLEKGRATYSSILAAKTPWTEEPSRLRSLGGKELDTTEQISLSLS